MTRFCQQGEQAYQRRRTILLQRPQGLKEAHVENVHEGGTLPLCPFSDPFLPPFFSLPSLFICSSFLLAPFCSSPKTQSVSFEGMRGGSAHWAGGRGAGDTGCVLSTHKPILVPGRRERVRAHAGGVWGGAL